MLQYLKRLFSPLNSVDMVHRELEKAEIECMRAQAMLDYYQFQKHYYETRINRLKETLRAKGT